MIQRRLRLIRFMIRTKISQQVVQILVMVQIALHRQVRLVHHLQAAVSGLSTGKKLIASPTSNVLVRDAILLCYNVCTKKGRISSLHWLPLNGKGYRHDYKPDFNVQAL